MLVLLRRLQLALLLVVLAAGAWGMSQVLGGSSEPLTKVPSNDSAGADTQVLSTHRLSTGLLLGAAADDRLAALQSVRQAGTSRSCAVLRRGDEELVATRPDLPLSPGLSQLFVTGYVALEVLGGDYTFSTQLLVEAPPDANGRVAGPVTLVGGGDPVLVTADRSEQSQRATSTVFDELANAVSAAGITSVERVIVDDGRYDDQRLIPGWSSEWAISGQIGLLGALQVDDGDTPDDGGTSSEGKGSDLPDPAIVAGERLVAVLAERGITTDKPVERASVTPTRIDAFSDPATTDPNRIGHVTSPPLREIVSDMWSHADPTTAELLLKEIGLFATDGFIGASSAAGGNGVQQVVRTLGVELPLRPRDGSGLDPTAQLTCGLLADIIGRLPAEHPAIMALPPITAPAFGGLFEQVHADQGLVAAGGSTLNASGLVGRVQTADGPLTFVSIVNSTTPLTPTDLLVQTEIVEFVSLLAQAGPQ